LTSVQHLVDPADRYSSRSKESAKCRVVVGGDEHQHFQCDCCSGASREGHSHHLQRKGVRLLRRETAMPWQCDGETRGVLARSRHERNAAVQTRRGSRGHMVRIEVCYISNPGTLVAIIESTCILLCFLPLLLPLSRLEGRLVYCTSSSLANGKTALVLLF
jgi:hypothetical protein